MDMEPTLTHFGYRVFRNRNQTREERQAEFAENHAAILVASVADRRAEAA